MKRYVAGFLFNKEGNQVALIEKQRPEWQKFQLNGIGGHIDRKTGAHTCYDVGCDVPGFDPYTCPWETPLEAMVREFREETGVELNCWQEYCVLSGPEYEVHFFQSYANAIYDVETKTDEQVLVYGVDDILNPNITYPLIPNLRWLIPMALSIAYEPHVVKYHVQEVNPYV
jgi:8-oxo-dGTP pyrophosphatase MutT (NUDIX family)